MRPKTILVCLTNQQQARTLLNLAIPIARRHEAHLVGFHTAEPFLVYPGIDLPPTAHMPYLEHQQELAAAIKDIFEAETGGEQFSAEWRDVRKGTMPAAERIVESARVADLVIMSQENKATDGIDQHHALVQVIRNSGRPVIVVPTDYDGPEVGNSVLLGWSDTREAARAAHDLLSIVADGAEIGIVRANGVSDEFSDFGGIDIAEMFARHRLKATLIHHHKGAQNVSEVLNQFAFECGADLIVVGAFGHSKTYDLVIGAATYALLRETNLPVMFCK